MSLTEEKVNCDITTHTPANVYLLKKKTKRQLKCSYTIYSRYLCQQKSMKGLQSCNLSPTLVLSKIANQTCLINIKTEI